MDFRNAGLVEHQRSSWLLPVEVAAILHLVPVQH
jgi:hypothetical protein